LLAYVKLAQKLEISTSALFCEVHCR